MMAAFCLGFGVLVFKREIKKLLPTMRASVEGAPLEWARGLNADVGSSWRPIPQGVLGMTEDKLDSLEQLIALHPNGTHAVLVKQDTEALGAWALDGAILKELIALSRIGLRCKCSSPQKPLPD